VLNLPRRVMDHHAVLGRLRNLGHLCHQRMMVGGGGGGEAAVTWVGRPGT
jgi:hypothetical protein